VKLNPSQLEKHLKGELSPVYLVSGDEPLLVDEALMKLRTAAISQGYTERQTHIVERGFDWDEFAASLQTMSLFAERRLAELRLPTGKPGTEGARYFASLLEQAPPDTIIIVVTPALTGSAQKTKWVSNLTKAGSWLPLYAPDHRDLPRWLAGRLKAAGLSADQEALQLLCAQIEGNLLAAKQEIDKLVLLAEGGRVDVDTVRKSVADGARFDVFQLTDAALAGQGARAARILYSLEREGIAAPLVLWSLVREITVVSDVILRMAGGQSAGAAMAQAGVWRNRQNLISHAVRGRKAAHAHRLMSSAGQADLIVKGAKYGQPWNALLELTMTLAGGNHWRAETA